MGNAKKKRETPTTKPSKPSFLGYISICSLLIGILGIYVSRKKSTIDNKKAFFWPHPFDSIEIVPLERKEWSEDFVSKVLKTSKPKPVVILNSPTSQWEADRKWPNRTAFLAQVNKRTKQAIKYRQPPNFIHYDEGLPLANKYPRKHQIKHMNIHGMFKQIDRQEKNLTSFNDRRDRMKGYYFNDEIQLLSPSLVKDIQPVQQFIVRDLPSFKNNEPKENYVEEMIKVWIGGPAGVVANLHYDASHNFFHQVVGAKRFWLFPPSEWPNLYVYSRIHPSHRQSQIDLTQPLHVILQKYPNFRKVKRVFEVILRDGDTLYMPPFWFHNVQTVETSISVNVWSNSKAQNDLEFALRDPLPYLSEFEAEGIVHDSDSNLMCVRFFLKMLIEKTYGSVNEFSSMFKETQLLGKIRDQTKLEQIPCGSSMKDTSVEKRLRQFMLNLYEKSFGLMEKSISTILLASFVESMIAQFLRPDLTGPFMTKCIFGKEF